MGGLQKLSRSSFSSKLGRLCWSLHSPAISRLGNALLYEAIIPTLFYSKYTLELNLLNSEVAFYHPTLEKRQSQHISPPLLWSGIINEALGKDLLTILPDNLWHKRRHEIQLSIDLLNNGGNTWAVFQTKPESGTAESRASSWCPESTLGLEARRDGSGRSRTGDLIWNF